MTDGKQRHGCLTAYLVFAILVLSIGSTAHLFVTSWHRHSFPNAPQWAFRVQGVVGIVHIVCLIALIRWRKWGFFGAAGATVLALIVNVVIGVSIRLAVIGLLGIGVLYGLLQIGGDRKAWAQLQ